MKTQLLVAALCLVINVSYTHASETNALPFDTNESGVPPAPEFWKAVHGSSNVSNSTRTKAGKVTTVPDSIAIGLTPPQTQTRSQTPSPNSFKDDSPETKELDATPVDLQPKRNIPLVVKPIEQTSPQPPKNAGAHSIQSNISFRPTERTGSKTENQASTSKNDFRIDSVIPSLRIVTAGPDTIVVGREDVYTLALSNPHEHPIQNVEILCTIPNWVKIVGHQSTAGSTDIRHESFAWKIPNLPAAANEQLRLNLKPTASHPFDLQVSIAVPSNQTGKQIRIVEPKLNVSFDGPTKGSFGETQTWPLRIENQGTGIVSNVHLQVFSNATPLASINLDVLAPGETRIADLELKLLDDGTLPLRAVARGDLGLVDSDEISVEIGRPVIATELHGPNIEYAGMPVEYRVRLSNSGNVDVEQVVTNIQLPHSVRYVDGLPEARVTDAGVQFTVESLAVGQVMDLPFRLGFSDGGIHEISAVSSGKHAAESHNSVQTEIVASADLKLDVIDSIGPRPVGSPDEYAIHVTNRGTAAARNIRVVAVCAPEVEPIDVVTGSAAIQAGQIFFRPIEELAANHQITYRVRVRASRSGAHAFRVVVKCIEPALRLSAEESTIYVDRSERVSVASREE